MLTKDEGRVLNDALGKLLGLDIYENLKEDLQVYSNNLKREGANSNIKEQIINAEKTIEINKEFLIKIEICPVCSLHHLLLAFFIYFKEPAFDLVT